MITKCKISNTAAAYCKSKCTYNCNYDARNIPMFILQATFITHESIVKI